MICIPEREVISFSYCRACYEKAEAPTGLLEHSGRELNAVYQKTDRKVLMRYVKRSYFPYPVYTAHYTES